VIDEMRKISDQIEAKPDLYMRRTYFAGLNKVRAQVAELINAETDEVVIVPNATHGINTIVNNIKWEAGDIIVICMSRSHCIASLD
jgi:selenocysteine lyase/cysteine desulfurase